MMRCMYVICIITYQLPSDSRDKLHCDNLDDDDDDDDDIYSTMPIMPIKMKPIPI